MWDSLGKILPHRLEQLRLRRGAEAQQALTLWEEIAPRHLGATHQTKAVTLSGEVLTVEVADGIWAQEVRLRQADLLRDLREGLPGRTIRRISTRLKR